MSAANSLVGTKADDLVGSKGVTALSNGNYVVDSPDWDNGAAIDAGAVTWGSGVSGVKGAVSAANSLVGTKAGDEVGSYSVTALSNGNYVVDSPDWGNGAAVDVGAVTWGWGLVGVKGAVSAANSLVGTKANDGVGNYGVTALSNGNYVVNSPFWDNGAAVDAGAATWGSGIIGVKGTISAANSLVGDKTNDIVGFAGTTALSNGNYAVNSYQWNNGAATEAGAVTWGNGTTGVKGVLSAANSLVGSHTNDEIGVGGITPLSNGNYVVRSRNWNDGASTKVGAVTWGSGTLGVKGAVSSANSLVGSQANDQVGNGGVTLLSNGNYVVSSLYWHNGAAANAGAATWGSGTSGVKGVVSAGNSLIGSHAHDQIGANVIALSNGNYVTSSQFWQNGAIAIAGAATWGNGTQGVTGEVSAANSLVGGHFQDSVGLGITALTNGNYVVNSLLWDNGGIVDAGAVTWGNGTTGVKGLVTALNSLVGTHTNDNIGSGGVTALSNGNYLVESSFWDYGAFAFVNAGAVSKGNGATGTSGTVSALNSVVGQASNAFLDPSLILDPVNHTFFSVFNGEGGGRVRVSLQ